MTVLGEILVFIALIWSAVLACRKSPLKHWRYHKWPFFMTLIGGFLIVCGQSKSIRKDAMAISCRSNLSSLNMALVFYLEDNKNYFPPASTWCDLLADYIIPPLQFPTCPSQLDVKCAYGFNGNLSEIPLSRIKNPASTVVFFESEGDWNSYSDRHRVTMEPRHKGGFHVSFVDGSTKLVNAENMTKLNWNPD